MKAVTFRLSSFVKGFNHSERSGHFHGNDECLNLKPSTLQRSEDHTHGEKRPKGNYKCVALFYKLIHVECTYMSKASRDDCLHLWGVCKVVVHHNLLIALKKAENHFLELAKFSTMVKFVKFRIQLGKFSTKYRYHVVITCRRDRDRALSWALLPSATLCSSPRGRGSSQLALPSAP